MSIIIADSGSTKTQWNIISNNKQIKEIFSQGINPYFISEEDIVRLLLMKFDKQAERKGVEKVFFYGAGCSLKEKCDIVYSAISKVFTNAIIEVESDLLASARAVFGNTKGVSCILGTGSNVAVYNGNSFTDNINSLGYALGDQASGANIGKELVRAYFQKEMPIDLRILFKQTYNIDLGTVLDRVYKQEYPNRYLASFAPFASENIENSFVKRIVTKAFREFVEFQLKSVEFDKNEYKVAFVGSIAYYFKDILSSVLLQNNYKIGKIIKAPMDGLLNFHCNIY